MYLHTYTAFTQSYGFLNPKLSQTLNRPLRFSESRNPKALNYIAFGFQMLGNPYKPPAVKTMVIEHCGPGSRAITTYVYAYAYVCVCVRESERERDCKYVCVYRYIGILSV